MRGAYNFASIYCYTHNVVDVRGSYNARNIRNVPIWNRYFAISSWDELNVWISKQRKVNLQ